MPDNNKIAPDSHNSLLVPSSNNLDELASGQMNVLPTLEQDQRKPHVTALEDEIALLRRSLDDAQSEIAALKDKVNEVNTASPDVEVSGAGIIVPDALDKELPRDDSLIPGHMEVEISESLPVTDIPMDVDITGSTDPTTQFESQDVSPPDIEDISLFLGLESIERTTSATETGLTNNGNDELSDRCVPCRTETVPVVAFDIASEADGDSLPESSKTTDIAVAAEIVAPTPPDGQHCFKCHTTDSSVWREDNKGRSLCNSCGLYYKWRGPNVPPIPIEEPPAVRSSSHGNKQQSPEKQGCYNCEGSASRSWTKIDGKPSCNRCWQYRRRKGVDRPRGISTNALRTMSCKETAAAKNVNTKVRFGNSARSNDFEAPRSNQVASKRQEEKPAEDENSVEEENVDEEDEKTALTPSEAETVSTGPPEVTDSISSPLPSPSVGKTSKTTTDR
ncbi:hypothetical protein C8J56DRAFT_469812 [Mycena floridula]|nr:hypothetical protein C8J56DRAFT_469812 [Mycena floridula]